MENVLIEYIRDEKRNPFGVVVATGQKEIGVSLCNPVETWNKDLGVKIAVGRAGKRKIHEYYDSMTVNVDMDKLPAIESTIDRMVERAELYFKQ